MEKQKRLLSVDALRGFDMLLISGGGAFWYDLKALPVWNELTA